MRIWAFAEALVDGAHPRVALIGLSAFLHGLLEKQVNGSVHLTSFDRIEDAYGTFDLVLLAGIDPFDGSVVARIHDRLSVHRVIQITTQGDEAVLYEMWPRRTILDGFGTVSLALEALGARPNWHAWTEGAG